MSIDTGSRYPIQLEALPPHWRAGYVGEFTTAIDPGFASGDHNASGEGVPHLRPMNVNRAGALDLSVLKFVAPTSDSRRLRLNDVLFNNTNSAELVGKTAFVGLEGDFAFSNHMTRLQFRDDVNPRFAALQLHYLWMCGYFKYKCVRHVNQASISSRTLASTVPFIWMPPGEQRRVVADVETQFSRLDQAVATLTRVCAQLRDQERAVLMDALAGTLVAGPSSRWRQVTVAEAGDVLLGRQRAPQYLTGQHPQYYLRVANIKDDRIDFGDLESMDFDDRHFAKYRLEPGDILVSEGQSPELLGQSAIFRGHNRPLCFQKTLHRFRAHPSMTTPEFAQIVFRAHVRSGTFRRLGSITTNIAHLTLEKFRAAPFPLPPLDEQRRIAAEVQRRTSILRGIDATVRANMLRAQHLRHAVLAQHFSIDERGGSSWRNKPATTLVEFSSAAS